MLGGGTPALHLQRPQPWPPDLQLLEGRRLPWLPPPAPRSCCCLEGPHLLPWPQAIHAPHRQGLRCQPHVESRIVVVCLCLLKLGREKRPPSQDCLECAPGPWADGSVSKLRKGAGRAGTGSRPGPGLPGTRRWGRETEGLPRDRGLLCVDAVLPSLRLRREALITLTK